MLRRVTSLIIVLCIVAIALYFVMLNRDGVTFYLSSSTSISSPLGVLVIAIFSIGLVLASFVALFFGIRSQWRQRKLLSKERERQQFMIDFGTARSLQESEEFDAAKTKWEQIIKKDPNNTIARIELSRSLELGGSISEAIKVMDTARSLSPSSIEVLLRTAHLHVKIGNKTAAIDNLALALYQAPSRKAARLARDLSEDLMRLNDALEYNSKLSKMEGETKDVMLAQSRILFKIAVGSGGDAGGEEKEKKLTSFLKQYPDNVSALASLASVKKSNGAHEEAVQLMLKAAKIAQNQKYYDEAIAIWLEKGEPDKALSVARGQCKEQSGVNRIAAELSFARLALSLCRFDDVKDSLKRITEAAQGEEMEICRNLKLGITIIKALMHSSEGELAESAELWKEAALLCWDQDVFRRPVNSASNIALLSGSKGLVWQP